MVRVRCTGENPDYAARDSGSGGHPLRSPFTSPRRRQRPTMTSPTSSRLAFSANSTTGRLQLHGVTSNVQLPRHPHQVSATQGLDISTALGAGARRCGVHGGLGDAAAERPLARMIMLVVRWHCFAGIPGARAAEYRVPRRVARHTRRDARLVINHSRAPSTTVNKHVISHPTSYDIKTTLGAGPFVATTSPSPSQVRCPSVNPRQRYLVHRRAQYPLRPSSTPGTQYAAPVSVDDRHRCRCAIRSFPAARASLRSCASGARRTFPPLTSRRARHRCTLHDPRSAFAEDRAATRLSRRGHACVYATWDVSSVAIQMRRRGARRTVSTAAHPFRREGRSPSSSCPQTNKHLLYHLSPSVQ